MQRHNFIIKNKLGFVTRLLTSFAAAEYSIDTFVAAAGRRFRSTCPSICTQRRWERKYINNAVTGLLQRGLRDAI
jgi:hypothetical protein